MGSICRPTGLFGRHGGPCGPTIATHINQILYDDAEVEPVTDNKDEVELQGYDTKFVWKTPFETLYLKQKTTTTGTLMNPLEALQCALNDFERPYRAGRPLPNDDKDKQRRLSMELH